MSLLSFVLFACLSASAFASPGQIPIVDGVIGGVPNTTTATISKVKIAASNATTAVGQLRVTENSGVCGKLSQWNLSSNVQRFSPDAWQRRRRASIQLPATGISPRMRVSGVLSQQVVHLASAHFPQRFWYFAARNNPDTAPLALWFNGGVRPPQPISSQI